MTTPIFYVTNREFGRDRYTHNVATNLAFGRFQMGKRGDKLRAGHFEHWEDLNQFKQNISAGGYDNLFLFFHGYNNTFNSAARAFHTFAEKFRQQDAHRTCFILLSWPSHGQVQQYLHDKPVIRACSGQFADTIKDLRDSFEPNRTHIMAHSMGGYMLLRCLRRLNRNSTRNDRPLGEVIWIAGNVKKNSIQKHYVEDKFYNLCGAPATSYYCKEDRALSWYKTVSIHQPLGFGSCKINAHDIRTHVNSLGHLMDNVRVPHQAAVNEDGNNCHTYFTANVVVNDIVKLINSRNSGHRLSPDERSLTRIESRKGWRL